ncbi:MULTISPECIES: threonine synthase [Mesonia]|uniref:Threonine synthase n=1 Tax=Mesonia oceanica TaxID=2687242 RepID=A0AC61YCD5_9FLAO|nr:MULTISPECIES: threonine synthase [Mesonia]MAN27171.1 threonine synthase [Mesonia sp.]MAQ42056.1 threonine synthase [Mesonia sp.]MBJ97587.1 threonine synthase [Flavobacteriaceae bacterium]VVV02161.1 Threonine synthase [Mesonia oceanica]|tara:strand:+ start:24624 stop:25916 length:1293 start_codon:yes stop_codon:yes gene_type:complete
MNYFSLNHKAPIVNFEQATVQGIAPDKGLYFPESLIPLDKLMLETIEFMSNEQIAYEVIRQFVNESIPKKELRKIVEETLRFDFPLVKLDERTYSLELFHGPTMAFKDVGARFMARCLGYFNRNKKNQKIRVLVATSGDTGGAVANGFLGVEGVEVIILYPSGKVSDIQEKQLTTLGQNITALEVDGTFDDCQAMVKKAFLDEELKELHLTSANSINVARWLPQMFYYFFAYKQLKPLNKKLVFSVPSGNFGNICAGILAKSLGLPIEFFVAATNVNDTVPQFLQTGTYEAKASTATISNAMDVGNPSNFIRIQQLFNNDIKALKEYFASFSFTDEETKKAMKEIYSNCDYIADPHGAVGYLGWQKVKDEFPDSVGVFLETAHPVKFLDIVEKTLPVKIDIPEQIKEVIDKEKKSFGIKNYEELKRFLKK